MKSTKIKRGRSKKESADDFGKIVNEALKGSHDAEPKKLATPPPHTKGSYGTNMKFHYKDGTSCTVMYSGCKDKPIDVYNKL